jgi:hypothetical protein
MIDLQGAIDNIRDNQILKKIMVIHPTSCYMDRATLAWHCAGHVALARPHGAPLPGVAAGAQASHMTLMIARTPERRQASASHPLASALANWESEGGAPGSASEDPSRHQATALSEGEQRVLQCLGAAVLLQWNDLPTPIQQQLFEHAAAMAEAGQTAQLKEQIARFLHTHKDDARASR